jgi:hypothetical protein
LAVDNLPVDSFVAFATDQTGVRKKGVLRVESVTRKNGKTKIKDAPEVQPMTMAPPYESYASERPGSN